MLGVICLCLCQCNGGFDRFRLWFSVLLSLCCCWPLVGVYVCVCVWFATSFGPACFFVLLSWSCGVVVFGFVKLVACVCLMGVRFGLWSCE